MTQAVSPELIEQFEEENRASYQKMRAALEKNDWNEIKEKDGVKFFSRIEEGSGFAQIMSYCYIPCQPSEITDLLVQIPVIKPSDPKESRHGYNERIPYYIDDSNDEHRALFFIGMEKPAPLIGARSFLLYRHVYNDNGTIYFNNCTVKCDEIAPENSNYVRGIMHFQGFIIEPTHDAGHEGEIKLYFLVHADPCGNIPAMIYNNVSINQGFAVKGVRGKILKDHEGQH